MKNSLRLLGLIFVLLWLPVIATLVFLSEDSINLWLLIAAAVLWPFLFLFWWLVFGKVPLRKRLVRSGLILLGLVGIGFLAKSTLRYEGSTSGTSLPKLSWKWTKPETESSTTPKHRVFQKIPPAERAAIVGEAPQFYGPERDGIWPILTFDPDWNQEKPQELWRGPVSPAWSSFAVADGKAITQEQRGANESVVAYDLFTGEELWVHQEKNAGYMEARHHEKGARMGGLGPRSTPTVFSGKVYTVGADGRVNCLELQTGRELWRQEPNQMEGYVMPKWGHSASPLILTEQHAVVTPGSEQPGPTLLAFDLDTGKKKWIYHGGGASYSSPRLLSLHGTEQIVAINAQDISGIDPATGEALWSYSWPGETPKVSQPILIGENRILGTASYGAGSPFIEIVKKEEGSSAVWTVREIWKSKRIKTKFSSVTPIGTHAYGLDEGRLSCVDLTTGDRVWKNERFGFGQHLLIGKDHLLVQTEDGDVVVGTVSPERFVETGRIPALDSMTWNVPVLAGRLLLCRNDREAVCYLLPDQKSK